MKTTFEKNERVVIRGKHQTIGIVVDIEPIYTVMVHGTLYKYGIGELKKTCNCPVCGGLGYVAE